MGVAETALLPANNSIAVFSAEENNIDRAVVHLLIASDGNQLQEARAALTRAGYKVTVLAKPAASADVVALLNTLAREAHATSPSPLVSPSPSETPRSMAERWAMKVVRGCDADRDLKTLGAWAVAAGTSYSSLCELCRLIDIQPLSARDLTRVLRTVVQSRRLGCRVGELFDICDRRTLNTLMYRAGLDPRRHGNEISIDAFLTTQRFVPPGNAGVVTLRALVRE